MRTRAERRESKKKEFSKREKLCKDIYGYTDSENDKNWIKHKTDIPHSLGSNWWNAYETKSMQNKQERLKEKNNLKKEIENIEE